MIDTEAAIAGFLWKWEVFLKIFKFYRKALVLESLFNKVAGLSSCNFI